MPKCIVYGFKEININDGDRGAFKATLINSFFRNPENITFINKTCERIVFYTVDLNAGTVS